MSDEFACSENTELFKLLYVFNHKIDYFLIDSFINCSQQHLILYLHAYSIVFKLKILPIIKKKLKRRPIIIFKIVEMT